jgi:hypothetical protein
MAKQKEKDAELIAPKFKVKEGWKQMKYKGVVYTPETLVENKEAFQELCNHLTATGNSSFVQEIFE